MSFNPLIPQSTSKRALSARQIRANYQAIFNAFSANHGNLGDEFLEGKHQTMVFQDETAPGTTADQVAIYNKIVGGIPNLFYQPNNSQSEIQLTYQTFNIDKTAAAQQTFIAGPFIIFTGFLSNVTNPQTVGPLSPGSSLVYVSVGTEKLNTANGNFFNFSAIATNVAGMSFDIRYATTAATPIDIYYLAIALP